MVGLVHHMARNEQSRFRARASWWNCSHSFDAQHRVKADGGFVEHKQIGSGHQLRRLTTLGCADRPDRLPPQRCSVIFQADVPITALIRSVRVRAVQRGEVNATLSMIRRSL